jgi:hypothetical protein
MESSTKSLIVLTQTVSFQTSPSPTIPTSTLAFATAAPTVVVTKQATSKDSNQTGEVVGVAVGVVAGALALTGALWWAWRYKKGRDTAAASGVWVVPANGQVDNVAVRYQDNSGNQIREIPRRHQFFEVDNAEVVTRS